jgi:oligopeptide transport system ATP-binding protein
MDCVTHLIPALTPDPATVVAERPVTLSVQDLTVAFVRKGASITVVNGVSFSVRQGETLALVGESGSGKSVTSLALMRLLPPAPRTRIGGTVVLRRKDGQIEDLLSLSPERMREIRGNELSMVFQEPMTSLNPVHTIGDQIAEAITFHRSLPKKQVVERTLDLLDTVGIPEPRRRLSAYPHHLSGGMRQRVMIAMALACDPQVMIADEPTTALDVTVQAQILELLKDLQARTGMSIIFITHNLGVVAEIADRVMVMYAGRLVEVAEAGALFRQPLMPYTQGLLRSVPRMEMAGRTDIILEGIGGAVPDPAHQPPGCAFHPRCPHMEPGRCTSTVPPLEDTGHNHLVRCVRWHELAQGRA